METASDIVKDALQEILVQASEQSVQAVDFQTGIRYLNRMMLSFESPGGIRLGYTEVSNAADLITVPNGAIEGIIFNLALRLAPSYDITPSIDLKRNARTGLDAMRKLGLVFRETKFPDTLPIGSGNEVWENRVFGDHFHTPELIPYDSEALKVDEINTFTSDFTLYLGTETITSFLIEANDRISVLSSSELDGIVTYSAKGIHQQLGTVCITVTTSTGRVNPRTISFDIAEGCPDAET